MKAKKDASAPKRTAAPHNLDFWKKYRLQIILVPVVLLIMYVLIYLCFRGEGFLSTGIDLEKSDWLAFLGAYLAFAGTIVVSFISLAQGHFYTEMENRRRDEERKRSIQPIFSVKIEGQNQSLPGVAEVFSLNDVSQSKPRHANVRISIENAGNFPVKHLIIFEKYTAPILKANESVQIVVAYEDSPDAVSWPDKVTTILKSEYEPDDSGVPSWFNICYEDVDGHDIFQTFKLNKFGGVFYYELSALETACSTHFYKN